MQAHDIGLLLKAHGSSLMSQYNMECKNILLWKFKNVFACPTPLSGCYVVTHTLSVQGLQNYTEGSIYYSHMHCIACQSEQGLGKHVFTFKCHITVRCCEYHGVQSSNTAREDSVAAI